MLSIVVDIGGTNLRVGIFKDNTLAEVRRFKVHNLANIGNTDGKILYQNFIQQLSTVLGPYLATYPDAPLAIAFPGPINKDGIVLSAPTLWGNHITNVPLLKDFENIFNRKTILMNDLSAATWRYAAQTVEDFCLITISSGIGNKVFRKGEILVNDAGQGGEMGHCQVSMDKYALPCDCGGYGHLGALASGRGIVQLARHESRLNFDKFLPSTLGVICQEDIEKITPYKIVEALKKEDIFTREILNISQGFLVTAMCHLYHAIGIKKFIFIGGFCCAVGPRYVENLNRLLSKQHWFGLSKKEQNSLCQMGQLDDDHSLIGLGLYLEKGGCNG